MTAGRRLRRAITERAGRAYVAGLGRDEAMSVCHRLARRGDAVVLGYWSPPSATAAQVAEGYAADVRAMAAAGIDGYVALKAPALRPTPHDLLALAQAGRDASIRLHWDAMSPDAQNGSLACATIVHRCGAVSGATLPSRWGRSDRDAETLAPMDIPVRLVKGQWAGAGDERDARRGMLAVAQRLAGRRGPVAVATHDRELARRALSLLVSAGTPCELELLFGLPYRPVAPVAALFGIPVRVYVPYGRPDTPYRLADAVRPRVMGRLVHDAVMSGAGGTRRLAREDAARNAATASASCSSA